MLLANADIANGLPANANAHQRPKKIPVAGAVAFVKPGVQANHGAVIRHQGIFFQIFRQIHQHFALRILVAAEEKKPLRIAKQVTGHFLLPGGEKTGVCHNAPAHTGLDLVPKLGKKHPVFCGFGNFFDIGPIYGASPLSGKIL